MKALIDFSSITDNFLDKSFQNVLFPYRFLQHLLFLSRFSIEYNCIRPHGALYYIFSFIGTTGLISYMFFCTGPRSFKKISNVLDAFFVVNSCVLIVPFYVFYAINVIQRKDHVKLILKIQKSYRTVKYKQYKQISLFGNWFGVFYHFFWILLSFILLRSIQISFSFYVMTFFDVNTTYGLSLIFMLRNGMTAWIAELEYQSKVCLEFEEKRRCCIFKKLFEAYEDLLEGFVIYKRLFRYSVSIFFVDLLPSTLLIRG